MKTILFLAALSVANAAPISLQNAGATFSQSGYPATETIDSSVVANNGWAIAPQVSTGQRIWWEAGGLSASGGIQRFDITMNFRGTSSSAYPFNIKRFVVAYTTDASVSATSTWIPLAPETATTSNPGAGSLSINGSTGQISLTGGDGDVSFNYYLTATGQPVAAITGFSIEAIPSGGTTGTAPGGNFILTEVKAFTRPPLIQVPAAMTISEGAGPVDFMLRREAGSEGNLNVAATVSGSASYPADYQRSFGSSNVFSFSGGNPAVPFTLDPLADAANESPESIVINWVPSVSYTLSSTTTVITIGDTNGSGFPDYIAGHGLAGNDALADADPNHDGISNIAAYAFRLNPAGPFPPAWRDRLPRFTTSGAGRSTFPAIRWQLPAPFPSDVRFIVEESEALASWPEIAKRTGYGIGSLWTGTTSAAVSDTGSPLKTVVVPGTQNMSARAAAFLRLRLEHAGGGGAN